jgi:hypothetical protein
MEAGTAGRTKWLRRKRRVLQDHAQVAPALGTPCLGPCGPRDMISSLSLDIRDNRPILHSFNLFRIHPDIDLANKMTQVLDFGGAKSTFRLFEEKLVLRE